MSAALIGCSLVAAGIVSWKWLRVSQREHYESGRCVRMARVWCAARPINLALLALLLALDLAGLFVGGTLGYVLAIAGVAGVLIWPYHLATFPRERALALTPRVRRLIALYLVVAGVVGAGIAVAYPLALSLWVVSIPLLVDLAAAASAPWESRLAQKYLNQARQKLEDISPLVVAITGSYGKTSTKFALATLLEGTRRTLVSPASFNNMQGLSKSVNDRLVAGVQVFVAEMGTYGPGEIRRLCEIFQPEIVAITTIGEAHLERMGDRATIVRAKSEIVERARTVVLNVDVPELADLANSLSQDKRVIRCSTSKSSGGDVVLDPTRGILEIPEYGYEGDLVLPEGTYAMNIAVAIGLALAVGAPVDHVVARVRQVRVPEHRAVTATSADGLVIIDDTYNSNPDGAQKALQAALDHAGTDGTVYVITPGMVELGRAQFQRNRDFAASIPADRAHLFVVGWTNRKALLEGAALGGVGASTAASRDEAAGRVGAVASRKDVILFENDLPDHYP